MLRTFDQQIVPRIKESYAGLAGFSSRQAADTSQALSDLMANLSGQRASLAYQDQALSAQLADSAANRQLQGLGVSQGLYQSNALLPMQAQGAYLQNIGQQMNLLSPFQQRVDTQAGTAYEQFLRGAQENSPWTNMALSFIGQPLQSAYNPQQRGGLGGALAGGLGGLMMAPGLSSTLFGSVNGTAAGLSTMGPLMGGLGFLGGLSGLWG